jgi:hypothetical protein
MTQSFNLVTCGCGYSFGSSKSENNYCTKCGSSSDIKKFELFEDAEKLSYAVSVANIPDEISDELISKIKKKDSKSKFKSMPNTKNKIQLMKLATNENGELTNNSLDAILLNEGKLDLTSDYLIGQAEMQGLLFRVNEKTWNWLS